MRGSDEIVDLLNQILTAELTAVNQYFLSSRMCDNWGFPRLAKAFRELSMGEMKDAEALIDRILYFEGLPNLQRLGSVAVGEDPIEQLRLALDVERSMVTELNAAIATCREGGDNGTRELLAEMLVDEEEHTDWLETQLDAIERLGETAYLAEQLHD